RKYLPARKRTTYHDHLYLDGSRGVVRVTHTGGTPVPLSLVLCPKVFEDLLDLLGVFYVRLQAQILPQLNNRAVVLATLHVERAKITMCVRREIPAELDRAA